ncbi:hypothetical protein VTP01DRAFT_5780 [Rhizomucor pusillus]|uniref:uncharacterized protein n=1 Tax=Rhizomucor pusillus TaxID=4840 RepID=UPI00374403AB
MKQDGFSVIGYCRKSCTNDDNGTRVRLLQTMVDRLQEKSLVDRVFVSPFSSADEEINSRDTQGNFAMNQLENVSGNTQDLISFLTITRKVCLIILDFAGLTTNVEDLKRFIKIIVISSTIYHTSTTSRSSAETNSRKAAPREIAESSTQTSRQTKISAVTKLQDSCRDMFCKKQLHRCSESRKRTPKASTNEHGIVQESLTSKGMIRSHAANGKEIARRNPSK